jgi:hypothetical protein
MAMVSRHRELALRGAMKSKPDLGKVRFGATPKPARETRALPFDPREQRHRFADHMPIRQTTPSSVLEPKPFFLSA